MDGSVKLVTLSCDDGHEFRVSAALDLTSALGTAPAMMDFLGLD